MRHFISKSFLALALVVNHEAAATHLISNSNTVSHKPLPLWELSYLFQPPAIPNPSFVTFTTDDGTHGVSYGLEMLFYNSTPCNEASFYATAQIALFGPSTGHSNITYGVSSQNMQSLTPCQNVGTGSTGYVTILDTNNPISNILTCQAYTNTTCTLGAFMPSTLTSGAAQFTITPSITPSDTSGGTISPYTLQAVYSGDSVAFTASPATGRNTYWYLDGAYEQAGTSYTLSSITSSHDVVTIFSFWTVTGITGGGTLNAVSCPSSFFCMAVNTAGQAFTYNGSTWSLATAVDSGHSLNTVSCPASNFCMALDNNGSAFSYDGTSWSSATVHEGSDFRSVSCSDSTFCMGVDNGGTAYSYTSGVWDTEGASLTPFGVSLNAVSCPASTFCMAVDDSGNVYNYSGTTWGGGQSIVTGSRLTAVSCPTTDFCMATNDDFGVNEYTTITGWEGSTAISPVYNVNTVSCANSSFCVAIDMSNNAIIFDGSGWGSPAPTAAPGTMDASNPIAISCPTPSFCMAIDGYPGVAQTYSP